MFDKLKDSIWKNKDSKQSNIKERKVISNLAQSDTNIEYTIRNINTSDNEMKNFLFTLGCYEGEKVTVISMLAENYIISVKDARYSIDKDLAKAIMI